MIGETVNNYRITQLIGEGGMGAVYLAEHPFMGRKAAIKVLRREFAEDPALVERFMNEARAANAIRHPNIIDIIDVGRLQSGIPYLMMEFLEGESLAQRLARGSLDMPEAIDIIVQTTAALAAAHGKGIVHRDLKPDNLFLVPDEAAPGGIRVKVLDFGIAKLRGDLSGGASKTQAGSLMGTPPYMSPEQCRGVSEEIDHRTDIYALGIIVYEMLCGAPPFVAAGWGDVVIAHMTKPPPSPRSRNASIPESIELVIMKALAKTVGERFQSATEMRTAFRSMTGAANTFPPRQATLTGSPAYQAAARPPTTFRTATGEMTSGETMAETPGAKRGARRGPLLIVGGLAAGAIVAVVALLASGGGVKKGSDAGPSVSPTATAPAAPVAPPSAPVAAPPRETPAAAQVLVRIASNPAGAMVTDAKRGVVIGATPFEQRFDRKATPIGVRLAKEGFASIDLDVPLDADFDRTVQLEHQKSKPSSKGSSAPHAAPKKIAVAGGSGPKPAASPASPPPAAVPTTPPPPAAPAKPKAEKW